MFVLVFRNRCCCLTECTNTSVSGRLSPRPLAGALPSAPLLGAYPQISDLPPPPATTRCWIPDVLCGNALHELNVTRAGWAAAQIHCRAVSRTGTWWLCFVCLLISLFLVFFFLFPVGVSGRMFLLLPAHPQMLRYFYRPDGRLAIITIPVASVVFASRDGIGSHFVLGLVGLGLFCLARQTPDTDFCLFSVSKVRFAFWAFFQKPENSESPAGSK